MNKLEVYDEKKVNVERVAIIEKWFKDHKTLPEKIENALLHQFLYSTYGDIEKTKNLLELHYNLRFRNPKFFHFRDPNEPGVKTALEEAYMLIVPTRMKENYNLSIFRLKDNDAEKFNMDNYLKAFTLFIDIMPKQYSEHMPLQTQVENVIIFDVSTITLKHLMKLKISAFRMYMKYSQDTLPNRLKQIHIINVSPISSKVISMSKPFMNSEVKKLLHVHQIGSETLHDFIPQSIMPYEYGGEGGKMEDLQKQMLFHIKENRDYLMDEKYWNPKNSKSAKN